MVGQVRTASVAMHLILQLGYFKAKSQFFVYEQRAVLEDLDYIIGRYFPDRDLASIKPLSKPTRLEQQGIILKLFDYQLCDSAIRLQLENKAERIAMISTQPVYNLAGTVAVPRHPALGGAGLHLTAGHGFPRGGEGTEPAYAKTEWRHDTCGQTATGQGVASRR